MFLGQLVERESCLLRSCKNPVTAFFFYTRECAESLKQGLASLGKAVFAGSGEEIIWKLEHI